MNTFHQSVRTSAHLADRLCARRSKPSKAVWAEEHAATRATPMNASKNRGSIPNVLMAWFDVFASSGKGRARASYLLDVQSDVLDGLTTRVVVALIEPASFPPVKLPADLRRRSISVEFGGCTRRLPAPCRRARPVRTRVRLRNTVTGSRRRSTVFWAVADRPLADAATAVRCCKIRRGFKGKELIVVA
jgi:hypothetical protein